MSNINDKLSEKMNDRGKITSYLLSPLSKITNIGKPSKFKVVEDPNSTKVNDLLNHNTIPVELYFQFLTFRDTDKKLELREDLSKLLTSKNYNVDLAKLSVKKTFHFAKEKHFVETTPGNKSPRDRSLIRFFKSPAITASGVSTKFLPENLNELCDRLKLL